MQVFKYVVRLVFYIFVLAWLFAAFYFSYNDLYAGFIAFMSQKGLSTNMTETDIHLIGFVIFMAIIPVGILLGIVLTIIEWVKHRRLPSIFFSDTDERISKLGQRITELEGKHNDKRKKRTVRQKTKKDS